MSAPNLVMAKDSRGDRYLKNSSMVALSKSMNLTASILGFDIIELWSHTGDLCNDDDFLCTYVHATPGILEKYPDIIVGYWPEHKRKHTVSPQVCRFALESKVGYYWHTVIDGEENINCLRSSAQTEMAYYLQGKEFPFHVFIVGFSTNKIEFLHSKIKFLSGIGYAIYVTVFVEGKTDESAYSSVGEELDLPEKIAPRRNTSKTTFTTLEDDGKRMSSSGSSSDLIVPMELVETYKDMNNNSFMAVGRFDDYSFPMHLLPVNQNVPVEDMKIEAVREITHFSDGSNSNIYSGKWHNEIVVVKMIKKQASFDVIALHEFDTEHEILSRIAHPNIISFLGGGNVPRRFLVLEWLGGGTLSSLINRSQSNRVAQGLFRQPTFTYAEILSRARELADAFDYLHCRVHDDLTVIHRDLKPDNVGFTATGVLKLLDMGLSTCVRRRRDSHIAYEMTGNTGSLRYMAPEVALRTAYTEKVDVYSFGILLWQMATDLVPFKGMSREEFMRDVAVGKLRPKLDGSWPVGFCNLLTTCWHHESIARPSFATVLSDLNALVEELDGGAWPKKGRSIRKRIGMAPNTDVEDPQSSWF